LFVGRRRCGLLAVDGTMGDVSGCGAFAGVALFTLGVITGAFGFSRLKCDPGDNESDFQPVDEAIEDEEEPLKMVLVVRMDLKMGKGKIAAQCCHAW